MIEWLSTNYGVNINAIILNYIKTESGEELLAKTSIISEELEVVREKKTKKFKLPMSDEPGTYDNDKLKGLLFNYLSSHKLTNQLIRNALLSALLKYKEVSRDQLQQEVTNSTPSIGPAKVGFNLAHISTQLSLKYNDFLRQIIAYDYLPYSREKGKYFLREEYREIVKEILDEFKE